MPRDRGVDRMRRSQCIRAGRPETAGAIQPSFAIITKWRSAMKRQIAQVIAVASGLALAGALQAQTRHDEKPHGPPKNAASATKTKQVKQPKVAGRHDERPHGVASETPAAGTGNK
jgi:hypothetical protein